MNELICCDSCLTARATVRLVWADEVCDDDGVFCCWNCASNAIQHHGGEIREVLASGPWQVPR